MSYHQTSVISNIIFKKSPIVYHQNHDDSETNVMSPHPGDLGKSN